jgi:hypothetical protein
MEMTRDELVKQLQTGDVGAALDLAIWNMVSDDRWFFYDEVNELITTDRFGPEALGNPHVSLDQFSRSLDAAIGLVNLVAPEWTAWEIKSRGAKTRFMAELSKLVENDHEVFCEGYSFGTPAAAVCAALLKATEPPK